MTADQFAVGTQMAVLFPADQKFFRRQWDDPAVVPASHDFQLRLQHRHITPPDVMRGTNRIRQ